MHIDFTYSSDISLKFGPFTDLEKSHLRKKKIKFSYFLEKYWKLKIIQAMTSYHILCAHKVWNSCLLYIPRNCIFKSPSQLNSQSVSHPISPIWRLTASAAHGTSKETTHCCQVVRWQWEFVSIQIQKNQRKKLRDHWPPTTCSSHANCKLQ